MNNTNRSVFQRFQILLAALPVCVFLFVLLSSITHQYVSAKPVELGFIGSFNELTVAIQSDSSRVQINKKGRETSSHDNDSPSSLAGSSVVAWSNACTTSVIHAENSPLARTASRFLSPLLRAPPIV